jgi:hypothetical protein
LFPAPARVEAAPRKSIAWFVTPQLLARCRQEGRCIEGRTCVHAMCPCDVRRRCHLVIYPLKWCTPKSCFTNTSHHAFDPRCRESRDLVVRKVQATVSHQATMVWQPMHASHSCGMSTTLACTALLDGPTRPSEKRRYGTSLTSMRSGQAGRLVQQQHPESMTRLRSSKCVEIGSIPSARVAGE